MLENVSRPRLLGSIVLLLGMALALGACGGDSNSSPPAKAEAPLTTPIPAATPTPNPSVAAACVASGAMGVIVNSTTKDVSIYAPAGDWSNTPVTGVYLVPLEGGVSRATIPTTQIVNSCSGNSITGAVICSADNNDVYLINGSTLTKTVTSIGTGTVSFSGGTCTNCNSAVDPLGVGIVGLAREPAISPGAPTSLYQFFALSNGASLGAVGVPELSESPAIEPNKHWLLSATETGDYDIVQYGISSHPVFLYAGRNTVTADKELDGGAIDCTTDIAVASVEFSPDPETEGQMFISDLTQAKFTAGSPGSWTAPAQVQTLIDVVGFTSTGITVAPGGHVGMMQAEFGGNEFAGFRLPATSGSGTPAVQDWVEALVPNTPSGPWSNTFDPHGVTSYVSPSSGNPMGVLLTANRTFVAVVDINALLAAPRVPGSHVISPGFNLVSHGVLRFVKIH
jgi:hypothetical protein